MIEWVPDTCALRSIVEKLIADAGCGLDRCTLSELLCDGLGNAPTFMRQRFRNFVKHVLPAYPPVMHIWFFSQFRAIAHWFETRLRYTRSVAVWSIVGYVLGLGDRHAENILVSQNTGACVHVDFSCLFDKAKKLEIPETVPFRLTQNIVDGMGIMKTEGVFAASARLVVERLRVRKQGVVAVLTTFVNDPLLEWKKADETQTASQARMTLKEIEDRLTGWADDRSGIGSPECVVRQLIAKATDKEALAGMFIGWQAYL
jgi:serine/threonine-protein kinase ATR